MKKPFNREDKPKCEYCAHGRLSPDESSVLCEKRGIMELESFCKSFKYDPLRRRTKPKPSLFANYTADDFKL